MNIDDGRVVASSGAMLADGELRSNSRTCWARTTWSAQGRLAGRQGFVPIHNEATPSG